MRRTTVLLALLAALAAAPSAQPAGARTTATRAETNLLLAPQVLRPLRRQLVDTHTNLVRNNTRARCTGRGRVVGGAYPRFVCVVARGGTGIRVLYIAKPGNRFEARRLG